MQQPDETTTTEITASDFADTTRRDYAARLRLLRWLAHDVYFAKAFDALEIQASGNPGNLNGDLLIKIRRSKITGVSVEFKFEG